MSWPLRSATTRFVELRRILEAAVQTNRALVERAGHAAHRRGEVLQPGAPARPAPTLTLAACKPVRIELDGQLALDLAEHLHVGDAGDRRAARA